MLQIMQNGPHIQLLGNKILIGLTINYYSGLLQDKIWYDFD